MLHLTGEIGGKYYRDSPVTVDELKKLIPEMQIPSAKSPKTRFPSKYEKKSSHSIPNKTTGLYKGRTVIVEYFEGEEQMPLSGGIRIKRTPQRIMLAHGLPVQKATDEKLAYLALSIQNGESPLRRSAKGGMPQFYFDAPEKVADAKWKERLEFRKIEEQIENMPISSLRIRAKGLRVKGQGIYNVDGMTDVEVKESVMQLAETNRVEFMAAWASANTDIGGLIQDAVDRNIIVSHPRGSKEIVVSWSERYHGGGQLVAFDRGQNMIDVLKGVFVRDIERLLPMLKESLTDATIAPGVKEQLADVVNAAGSTSVILAKRKDIDVTKLTGPQMVAFALDNNILVWDTGGGFYRFEDEKNNFYIPSTTANNRRRALLEDAVAKDAGMREKLADRLGAL